MGNAYEYEYLPSSLTETEVMELFKRYENGNFEARNRIIQCNLRFIVYIVDKCFINSKYDREELISVGQIGLIKAVDNFSLSRNVKFSTYASTCICNEILMMFRLDKKNEESLSLDNILSNFSSKTSDGFERITFLDFFSDDAPLPEQLLEEKELKTLLMQVVDRLDDRNKTIIKMLYGLDGKVYTQGQIARSLGITQSYISRLKKSALEEIRNMLLNEGAFEMGDINKNTPVKSKVIYI